MGASLPSTSLVRTSSIGQKYGMIFADPAEEPVRQIDTFLTGLSVVVAPDRALTAILFTDIVGSTERASAIGDQAWRNLLATHDALARILVDRHKGRVVKRTGDGMLATFDGPGRAIRCALSLSEALRSVGLEIRAGLHTGEVEVMERTSPVLEFTLRPGSSTPPSRVSFLCPRQCPCSWRARRDSSSKIGVSTNSRASQGRGGSSPRRVESPATTN